MGRPRGTLGAQASAFRPKVRTATLRRIRFEKAIGEELDGTRAKPKISLAPIKGAKDAVPVD